MRRLLVAIAAALGCTEAATTVAQDAPPADLADTAVVDAGETIDAGVKEDVAPARVRVVPTT